MSKPSPQQLTQALDDAGGFRITNMRPTEAGLKVTADWQGERLEFDMQISEVHAGQIPTRPKARSEAVPQGARGDLYQQKLTEDQARQLGLPLYYAEQWLRQVLDELGSYAEIERVYGYPIATLHTAARFHGWEFTTYPKAEVKRELQQAWKDGKRNKSALAREFNVSRPTVNQWINELE